MNIKDIIKSIPGAWQLTEKIAYSRIVDVSKLPVEQRVEVMMNKYEAKFGYRMDINNPRTYTEKVQWYKAYYVGDGHLERVADKYLLKDYVKEIDDPDTVLQYRIRFLHRYALRYQFTEHKCEI